MSILVTRPRNQYPVNALSNLTVDFGLSNAHANCWLAQLAYEQDVDKIDSILLDWGLSRAVNLAPKLITLPLNTKTQGLVLIGHDRTIVTFAGTDPLNFADWVTDLRFVPDSDGVHEGFARALDPIWPDIEAFLRSTDRPKMLWVVGHSLGAALAALCAQRAHRELGVAADAIYVFGMPRVGGREFASKYEIALGPQTFRLVHGHDIVPAVPPSAFGFQHVGRRLACAHLQRFDPRELARNVDDEPFFPAPFVASVAAVLKQFQSGSLASLIREDPLGLAASLLPPAIADHLPVRYCTATAPHNDQEATMENTPDVSGDTVLDEATIELARSDREGLNWWLSEISRAGGLETAQPTNPRSKTPISSRAFDLIVEFEVSSKQVYESRYRVPIWPKGASGVTVGIGYDVGYAAKGLLHSDWDGAIAAAMVSALEAALGVQGANAQRVATALRGQVDIPWDAAIGVHRGKVVPRWVGLVESHLSNTNLLAPDSLGALTSLSYNRGASFDNSGDRYTEMRAIKMHMAEKAFGKIPDELRSMKRLWPQVVGLQVRREREAKLFELGLSSASS